MDALRFLGFGQLCCVYICFFAAFAIAKYFYYLNSFGCIAEFTLENSGHAFGGGVCWGACAGDDWIPVCAFVLGMRLSVFVSARSPVWRGIMNYMISRIYPVLDTASLH